MTTLSQLTVKAYLNLFVRDDRLVKALLIFFSSFVMLTAFPFYPIPLAFLLAGFCAYVSYKTKPQIASFLLLGLLSLSFSFQSTEFFLFYLVLLSPLLFILWDNIELVLFLFAIIFFPISSLFYSISFLVVFPLLISYLYLGSKKAIAFSVFSVYFISLFSSLIGFSTPLFPSIGKPLFELSSPSNFFEDFGVAVENALNFRAYLSLRYVLENIIGRSVDLVFTTPLVPLIISYSVVGYSISVLSFYLRKNRFSNTLSSLALFILPISYYGIYGFGEVVLLLLVSCAFSSFAMLVLEWQGFKFSRELVLRKKEQEKSFSKFGLKELTLGGAEKGLEDFGGYEDVKEELKDSILVPLKNPEVAYAYKLKPTKGILLFGPPGTGKTMLMRALAKEIDYPFFYVKTSELLSHFYGETERNISEVFKLARKNAPCIIFFDEVDAIAKDRKKVQDDVSQRVLSTLLQELDGFDPNDRIIFVASTNVPNLLDPALLRPGRIDKIIYMRLPTKEERKEIFKVHTKGLAIKDIDFDELAKRTERFSGADIASLVKEVKLRVAKKASKLGKVLPITMKDFLEVLERFKPSTSLSQLEEYERFKLDFERRGKKVEKKAKLSFKDVVDMEREKELLREAIEIPLKHSSLVERYKVRPTKGILLFGPPGTGKSFLIRAASGEFGVPLYEVRGSELLGEGYSKALERLKDTLNSAKENSPSLVFIDEIDTLFPSRALRPELLGQLLQEMDKLKGVLIVGATNRPFDLDSALLRPGRFDKIVYVGPPSKEVRKALFKHYLGEFAKGLDLDKIASLKLLSPADIEQICSSLKYRLLKDEVKGIKRNLTTEEVLEFVKNFNPSISPKDLTMYEEFKKKMERS